MYVKMINSVGEYEAGKSYNLKKDEADYFILSGYAEGELSREFSEEERQSAREKNQSVGV